MAFNDLENDDGDRPTTYVQYTSAKPDYLAHLFVVVLVQAFSLTSDPSPTLAAFLGFLPFLPFA